MLTHPAAAADLPAPPPYKQLRYDENYEYLRDPARRTDLLDPIKYIPLTESGTTYLSLGGEARERYEYFHHSLWGRGPQDDDGYLLQRYLLHADLHASEYFRAFVQLQSSIETDRVGGPRPTDKDLLELHQAFFDLKAPFPSASVTLRVGRQELEYGSSRLLSFREGPNNRSSFDGLKLFTQIAATRLDLFAAKPVETRPDLFDDGPQGGQKLWGLYTVTPLAPDLGLNADFYYIGLERRSAVFAQGPASELRHTFGARVSRKQGNWDCNYEFVYQSGTFGAGDISAWTAASDQGYTFHNVAWKPRLGFKADATSGDQDPKNPDLQTFNPLFPRGAYFGEPALIGPANHIDLHPELDLHPWSNLTFTLDWDFFWRESIHDGIYGPAVNVVVPPGQSRARYVGDQLQALVEWKIERHISLTGVYARFFAGEFLKETTPGKDVDYVSAWLTFKF